LAIIIGLTITMASLLGGFAMMGGHILVIWQPWEFVIIGGTALGTYIVANPIRAAPASRRARGASPGSVISSICWASSTS
jgi:chemotaxis protein MotA